MVRNSIAYTVPQISGVPQPRPREVTRCMNVSNGADGNGVISGNLAVQSFCISVILKCLNRAV